MKIINNNKYWNNFLDLVEDLAYIKDLDGKYIACNKAFCNATSLTKEDIIGKTDYDLFIESDAILFNKNDKRIIKNAQKEEFYESLTKQDNEILHFRTTKDVIRNDNNDIVGLHGISKDITEETEYKTLYKTSQKILEKTIEDLPLKEILTFIIKEAESINPNMICSILLLDSSKKHFKDGFAPSLPDFYNEAVKTLTLGEGVGSCGTAATIGKRVIVENIDEHPYWAEYKSLTNPIGLHACWSQPFFSNEKEVLGTFAIYYNRPKAPTKFELELIDSFAHFVSLAVNKRKKLDEIKEHENILNHQSKMATLGEMLENIAHQWRQPLSVISTVCSNLKLDKEYFIENDEMYDKSLSKVINTTQYLSNTINDFRTYFLKNKQKEKFYLSDTIEKSINIVDAKFIKSNINYVLDIDEIELTTYENELIHVIINLLNNAKDALEVNNIENKLIFITVKKQNNDCIIKIKDNAKGIPEKIINRIFEPYFTTKHKDQGTGIGLYMVQDILNKHIRGLIKVKNSSFTYKKMKYNGAEFKISIPLKEI